MFNIGKKIANTLYIGVYLQDFNCNFVWLDEQHNPHQLIVNETQIDETKTNLFKQLAQSNFNRIQFICAIPSHRIWSKTLIIPQHLNDLECEQQSQFVLQNELPIPLEDIWSDYCIKYINDSTTRLDIFALNRHIAEQHLMDYHDFNIAVLDSEARAILRSFYFLCPEQQNNPNVLWIYQDEQQIIALQQKPHQFQLLHQIHSNLTALFEQFCQRYDESPQCCIFYSTLTVETPPTWQRLTTNLPFIALGCALWNKNLL